MIFAFNYIAKIFTIRSVHLNKLGRMPIVLTPSPILKAKIVFIALQLQLLH